MNLRMRIIAILVVGVLALGQFGQIIAADPKPPESMTYQGYLVDSNGVPLGNSAPANYDVVFRIYNAKSGGEPIWTEQQTITVDKGYFSVLLGEGSTFGNEPYSEQISTVFVGEDISDRFIGITVSGISGGVDLEIAPRLRLVTSPYSFTATQARNVIDGSGNRNIFKEVDSNNNASLKLGAGSDTTLTLHEDGGATLAGNLAIDLPTAGVGMEINEQGLSTKFGGLNGDRFSISTARGGFHFDKSIYIDGDIYSFNRDARLYPSNNTDNFLNVNHERDTIDAYTDKFYIIDEGVSYLEINPTTSQLSLLTDAGKYYMNKSLHVDGSVLFSDGIGLRYPTGLYGSVQTTGEGKNGWEGYSIDGRFTYMSADSNQVGLYDHISGEWIYIYERGTDTLNIRQDLKDLKMSGWIGRTSHHNGGLEGSYNNVGGNGTKSNPIYVIGSDYKPSENSLSNMYGIGYTSSSASFITGQASGWGLYIAGDGDARTFLSGQVGNSYINKDGGSVGIGTDSPIQELHIKQRSSQTFAKGLRLENWWGYGWNFGIDSTGFLVLGYQQGDDETYKAYVNPNSGTWTSASDSRLKKDIESSEDVLSKVYKLKPVSYRFNEQEKNTKKHYGFIAQDVQKLFPYLVDAERDYLGLDYGNFGVLSIKAIQELGREKDAEVASLEQKNEQLESRVQSLDSELSLVKAQLAKLEEIINNIDKVQ